MPYSLWLRTIHEISVLKGSVLHTPTFVRTSIWRFFRQNKNRVCQQMSVRYNNLKVYTTTYFEFFFMAAQVNVDFWVVEKRGGQVRLLKLQLSPIIVPTTDLCFPIDFNSCFHVEGVQSSSTRGYC